MQDAPEQSRLYQAVASRLIADLATGRYPVGKRLPAERELAAELGVSRPTLREAIIALEVQGLVEVRLGSGVYVRRTPGAEDQADTGIGAFELTEARLLFEGEAAALAATLIGEADLARLDALTEEMSAANAAGGGGEVPDRAFHMTIAEATGNAAIVRTVASLWDLRTASPQCALLFERARRGGSMPIVDEHARIVAALRSRHPGDARAAMRAHLSAVIDHLLVATEADEMERARAAVATTRSRYGRAASV